MEQWRHQVVKLQTTALTAGFSLTSLSTRLYLIQGPAHQSVVDGAGSRGLATLTQRNVKQLC